MLCILFFPEREPVQKGALPAWEGSREIFNFPEGERKASSNLSKVPTIMTTNIVLKGGVNMVEDEKWEQMLNHPPCLARLTALQKYNAIESIKPDAETYLGCSTDFTMDTDAMKVINATNDDRWLEFSEKRENRYDVLQAVRERREFLAERKKALTQIGA